MNKNGIKDIYCGFLGCLGFRNVNIIFKNKFLYLDIVVWFFSLFIRVFEFRF